MMTLLKITQCVLPFDNACFNEPEPHITWHLLTSISCLISRYPMWPDIISPLYLVWSAGIPCGLTHYSVLWHSQRHLHLDQKCQNDSCRSSVLSWWTLTLLQPQNHSWLCIWLCWQYIYIYIYSGSGFRYQLDICLIQCVCRPSVLVVSVPYAVVYWLN